MNKRKVALALAAALGINTLAITVGNINGQVQIAHAQETRLTDKNEIARLNGLKIKTLETSVNLSKDKNGKDVAAVTLKNVNTSDVKNVTTSKIEHKYFNEREDIDKKNESSSVNAKSSWENGKLNITGAEKPGIYSTTITIEYNDGKKEDYKFSLVKKASDTLKIEKVDVRTNSIVVENIEFNGNKLNSDEEISIREKGSSNIIETVKYKNDKGAVFNKNISFDKGKIYEIVYKFGKEKEHEVVAELVLVKEEEQKLDVIASNSDSDVDQETSKSTTKFFDKISKGIQYDYGVESNAVTKAGSGYKFFDMNYSINVNNVPVLSYEQTVKATDKSDPGASNRELYKGVGGAKLEAKIDKKTEEVSLKIEKINTLAKGVDGNTFVNYMEIKPNGASNVFCGNYTIKIGDNTPETYLDASSKITDVKINGVSKDGLSITGGISNFNTQDKSTFSFVPQLEHGYTVIPITFSAEDTEFGKSGDKKTAKKWAESAVKASFVQTPFGDTPVKTALLIRKDDTHAVAVNASFLKTSESTGELTLSGGKALVKNINVNEIANKLKVDGATVALITDGGDDLKFRVTFNGQVPNTINWTFDVDDNKLVDTTATLGGNLSATQGIYETVNLVDGVKATNENTTTLVDQFELVAKFGGDIPSSAVLGFENTNHLRVTYKDLGTNNGKRIKANVGVGKYQGEYQAGIWVERQPFTVQITKVDTSTSSATLTIDANFFEDNKEVLDKVTSGRVEYRKVGDSNWIDSKLEIKKEDIKEEAITRTVAGLVSGTEYEFRVVYNYVEGKETKSVESNVVKATISNSVSSGSGNISGNSGSSGSSSSTTTGSSTGSTTINTTTSNTIKGGTDVVVTLPSGFKYDGKKNPVPVNFKYKGKDGKVVTEKKEDFSIVKASFDGDKLKLEGLVPGKDYTELHIDYTDNNNKTRTIILKNVKLESSVELEKYLANVYMVVFNRPADESGYHFHLGNLKGKKVSIREFLLNMLTEKEFIETYKTTESKIEALYSGIVGRESDAQGKDFWVSEYKKLLSVYGNEASTLKAIADRMVNEKELKELADRMGILY